MGKDYEYRLSRAREFNRYRRDGGRGWGGGMYECRLVAGFFIERMENGSMFEVARLTTPWRVTPGYRLLGSIYVHRLYGRGRREVTWAITDSPSPPTFGATYHGCTWEKRPPLREAARVLYERTEAKLAAERLGFDGKTLSQ